MAGKKRAAPDSDSTRPAKTTKTGTGRAKGKTGPKANLTAKAFKSQALPLHVSITQTPPVVEELGEKAPTESTDPGFLTVFSLQPSSFSTGTYGWKGSKRTTVEVGNSDTGERLQVQLTFNATVLGSKGKDGEDEETKEEEEKKEGKGEGKDEEKDEEEKEDKEGAQEE